MRTTETDGSKKERPYPVEASLKNEHDASEVDPETADLITAVQFGSYERVVQLIEADPSLAQSEDTEKITPLHWAALNNRVEICEYLVGKGATVDAVGGALRSTPLQWAIREGKLEATICLISKNAQTSMIDGQGFSAIHLASIFGYTEIVGYLVALGEDVNAVDQSGNTPLMHVAYNVKKRDPAQLLIRLGATINAQNPNNKYTALHCAIAGNNPHVIRILLDAGAKTHLRNADNEDVFDFAAKYKRNLLMLLITFGPSNEGLPRLLQFNPSTRRRAMTLLPYITIFALLLVLDIDLIWYYKLLAIGLVIIFVYTYSTIFHSFVVDNRIPISVAQATILWLYASYLYYFLPYIHMVSWPVLILGIFTYFSWKNFYLAQKTDPGYVSTMSGDQTNRLIIQLVERDLFDDDHFCTYCLVRRPLRSKHCRECRRCVAKFDHHCPWIDNCVGDKNMNYFLGFIFFTPLCLLMFLHGCYRYFDQHCNVFAAESFFDGFHRALSCGLPVVFLTGAAFLYAFWIFSLFVTIISQVSSGLTTNERMNYWRYKYLHTTRRSPFSFGILQNLVDMLNRRMFSYTPITLDWLQIYTMDEFFQLTSDQFRRTLNV